MTNDHIAESHVVHRASTSPHRVVLRNVSHPGKVEFVTHFETVMPRVIDGRVIWKNVCYFYGHYFRSEEQALADFNKRVKEL